MSVAMFPRDTVPPGVPSSPAIGGAAHEELLLVGRLGVNLLLVGSDSAISQVVDIKWLGLRRPIAAWRPGDRLVLPPMGAIGTLILHDVDKLSLDDQVRLLGWLEPATGNTRVVSTTSAPLFQRVESGKFIATLYYRLNTVCVNVTPP